MVKQLPIQAHVKRVARIAADAGYASASDEEPSGDHRSRDLAAFLDEQWAKVIPPDFHDATIDDLTGSLSSTVAEWNRHPGPKPNLVLLGPTGAGKTYAAVAAVRADHYSCLSTAFYSVPRLLFDLRPGSPVSDRTADVALGSDRLILDDVGAERDTDWTHEQLWLVVNERRNAQSPIVATSNLSVATLAERLGDRIASRLLGGSTIVLVSGEDRRRG